LIMALSKFNIIPRNGFTESFVQIGSALEVILLSFALADRLNEEKRRRSEAQALALQNEKLARKSQEEALEQERYARQAQEKALQHEREAREAQTRALEIQMQATETLERRVKERTEELENVNRRLEFMSITDPLTNVRNRRYFDQIIKREMSRAIRQRESICVLMVDIDFFKKINDTYGHQAGDDVLRAVAQAIGDSVHRSTDLLARYGGEEFILVLPNTAIEGALYVGETVRTSIANLVFDYISPELRITASIGVHGGIPDASVSDEKWTKLADDALYYAKENGRNQVVLHADIPEDKKPQ
ncbi:MAG: diguanylate cyclase, partial [Venatoribacter sp.]